jgi:hypothetical protein
VCVWGGEVVSKTKKQKNKRKNDSLFSRDQTEYLLLAQVSIHELVTSQVNITSQ